MNELQWRSPWYWGCTWAPGGPVETGRRERSSHPCVSPTLMCFILTNGMGMESSWVSSKPHAAGSESSSALLCTAHGAPLGSWLPRDGWDELHQLPLGSLWHSSSMASGRLELVALSQCLCNLSPITVTKILETFSAW